MIWGKVAMCLAAAVLVWLVIGCAKFGEWLEQKWRRHDAP